MKKAISFFVLSVFFFISFLSPTSTTSAATKVASTESTFTQQFCSPSTAPEQFLVRTTTNNVHISPGQMFSFNGTIESTSFSALSNASLYAVVEKKSGSTITGNTEAVPLVGYFLVKDSITLNLRQRSSFDYSWQIPPLATEGEYSVRFVVIQNNKVIIEDQGQGIAFNIGYSDTKKALVSIGRAVATVKNKSTSLLLTFNNSSAKSEDILLTTSLFPWDITSIKPIQSKSQSLHIAPSGNTPVQLTINNLPLPQETVLVHFISTNGASSTVLLTIKNPAFQQTRITQAGIKNFPLTNGSNSSAFICLFPTTFSQNTKTKVTFDLMDEKGHVIQTLSKETIASSTPTGWSVPLSKGTMSKISVKASVYKNGVLSDSITTSYDCTKFPEGGCGPGMTNSSSVMSLIGKIIIAVLALLIIVFALFEWWKKRKSKVPTMILILGLLFTGNLLLSSNAFADGDVLISNPYSTGFVNNPADAERQYGVPSYTICRGYYGECSAGYTNSIPSIYEEFEAKAARIGTDQRLGGFYGYTPLHTVTGSAGYTGTSYPTDNSRGTSDTPGWDSVEPACDYAPYVYWGAPFAACDFPVFHFNRETIASIVVTSLTDSYGNLQVGDSLVPSNRSNNGYTFQGDYYPSVCTTNSNHEFTTAYLPIGSHILVTLSTSSLTMIFGSKLTNTNAVMRPEVDSANLLIQPGICSPGTKTYDSLENIGTTLNPYWAGYDQFEVLNVARATRAVSGLGHFNCTAVNSTQTDCVASSLGVSVPTVTFATTTAALFWSNDTPDYVNDHAVTHSCKAISGSVTFFDGTTGYDSVIVPSTSYTGCAISIEPPQAAPDAPTIAIEHQGNGSDGGAYVFSATASDPNNDNVLYEIDWDKDGYTDQVVSLSDMVRDGTYDENYNDNFVHQPNYDSNNPTATTTASGEPLNFNGTYFGAFYTSGPHSLNARTQDARGAYSTWTTFDFTVYDAPPDTTRFDVTTSPSCGAKINLSWDEVPGATGYNLYNWDTNELIETFDASTTSYTFTGDTPDQNYNFKLITLGQGGHSYGTVAWANSSISCDAPPPAPTNLTVTTSASCGGKVDMSWSASPTATGYNIYKMDSDYIFQVIDTVDADTLTYTDTPIPGEHNAVHDYYVTAINTNGESDPSDSTWAESSDSCTPTPEAPNDLVAETATACGGKIDLSWTAVSAATSYTVYRWNWFNGVYDFIGSTSDSSYQDTADEGYNKYVVYSNNENGVSTDSSNETLAQGSQSCEEFIVGDGICSFAQGENHDNSPDDCPVQCADGIDNNGGGLIDAADPYCHTDGDPTNDESYDATDNLEGAPSCTRDNFMTSDGQSHTFYKKKLVPFDSNCDAGNNSASLTCSEGKLKFGNGTEDFSVLYPYATCLRAPTTKEI